MDIKSKSNINPKNKDNKCFQYSITVALNHRKIKNHPERISNIKPFIDNYKSIHESCDYTIDLVSSFDLKQDKHSFYRGRDCSKKC